MRMVSDVRVSFVACLALLAWGSMPGRVVAARQASTVKATATVGSETFTFTAYGVCTATPTAFSIVVGEATKGERFELNIPHPVRASDPMATKPTADGTYTHASLTVIPAGGAMTGKSWHAGGRTAREADLTVILKNNRKAGEFLGRTDGSPRTPVKGTFTCT